ncbi:MAG TPA: hypothetical protein VK601_21180 [Kofleriaceae bacterium]|nr:hypothetical protein [Kofleriaceae bacterium]
MRTSESIAGGAPVHGLRTPGPAAGALVACALAIGCDAAESPQAPQTAQQLFVTRAWPALGRCLGCHATRPAIDFLAPGTPAEAYPTLFVFQPPIVDVASPGSSLVLTMGKHTGPPLLPPEADAVLAWLEAERVERVPDGGMAVEVGPVSLALGAITTIDLGLGATLRFTASPAAGGIGLRQIELAAGPGGLHVVHPLFATHPPRVPPRIDASDAFGDVDVTLDAGALDPLGGGAAVLPDFDPADPISIHFRTLEAP